MFTDFFFCLTGFCNSVLLLKNMQIIVISIEIIKEMVYNYNRWNFGFTLKEYKWRA